MVARRMTDENCTRRLYYNEGSKYHRPAMLPLTVFRPSEIMTREKQSKEFMKKASKPTLSAFHRTPGHRRSYSPYHLLKLF
jgi:hypothetical protein